MPNSLQRLNMAMDKYELKDTLEELREIRGRNTELVSLYIPPDYDLRKIVDFLTSEKSESENIKSKHTRKNVQSALDKLQRRLKDAGEIPDHGIALFGGNVSEQEGRPDIELWEVEPPEPIQSRLYRCDKTFVVEPLEDILVEKDIYGLICLDKSEAAIGYVRGTQLSVEYTIESKVPGKTSKGGQCLATGTKVPLGDGRIVSIEELDGSLKVLSADFEDNSVTGDEASKVFSSQHDSFYQIRTSNPQRRIDATGNHRFFVFNEEGFEERFVENIEEGDFLITSRELDTVSEHQDLNMETSFRIELTEEGRKRLKEARKGAGLKQKELASEVDVSQTAISKFEVGERNPASVTLEKVVNRLGLDYQEFLEEFVRKDRSFEPPEKLTPGFARFLGYFQGDGSVDGNRLEFYEEREEVAEEIKSLLSDLFNLEPTVKFREDKNYYRIRLYCLDLVESLQSEFEDFFDNGEEAGIPDKVLMSSDKVLSSYIQGLYDAEGSVTEDEVSISTVNQQLMEQLCIALQRFGITASISEHEVDTGGLAGSDGKSHQYRLRVSEKGSLVRFKENIGFTASEKQEKLDRLSEERTGRGRSDRIPVRGSRIIELARDIGLNTNDFKKFNPYFRDEKYISYNRYKTSLIPTFEERVSEMEGEQKKRGEELLELLKGLAEGDLSLTEVSEKEEVRGEEDKFYDIEVPGKKNFVADGLVVHNSQQRFKRIRENMYEQFMSQVSEKSQKAFLEKAREKELLGLIVGGPGFSKEDLVDKEYLHDELVEKIIATKGTNYSGEQGLKELLNKSEDVIEESEVAREKNAVNNFLKNLKKDNGKSVYGLEEVAKALKLGSTKKILISEDFDKYEARFECPKCGNNEVKHTSEFKAENEDHECEECGSALELEEKKSVRKMFKEKAAQMGSEIQIISRKHEEGERLWNMGGVAAVLRYRIE
ncbi:MAG: helix-turn-helix domain-containing protein [Candidatus Nanohaloarchaeota archaeon QJJ-9]|nr:helix-turn-helix domain-containing protein [Candidatus Nanohaloarchaeota archaeon QJJ-9]